jgi:hypothetical protein
MVPLKLLIILKFVDPYGVKVQRFRVQRFNDRRQMPEVRKQIRTGESGSALRMPNARKENL